MLVVLLTVVGETPMRWTQKMDSHSTAILLSSAINVLLGVLVWRGWPETGLWVIGLFIGIEMILNGWTLVMLGLTAKNLPAEAEASPSPSS